jgi:hypothetical protein
MNTASALRERAKQKLASTTAGASTSAATGGGGGPMMASSQRASAGGAAPHQQQQPFETSDGAMRLNRLLLDKAASTNNNNTLSSSSPLKSGRSRSKSPGVPPALSSQRHHPQLLRAATTNSTPGVSLSNTTNNSSSSSANKKNVVVDYVPPSTIQLPDPTDAHAVGLMTCYISSKLRIDIRSIGGSYVASDGKVEARTGYVILRDGWADDNSKMMSSSPPLLPPSTQNTSINRVTNECLFSMCVSQFDLSVGVSGGPSGGKKRHIPIAKKGRNKLRYVVLVRSTNRPLLKPKLLFGTGGSSSGSGGSSGANLLQSLPLSAVGGIATATTDTNKNDKAFRVAKGWYKKKEMLLYMNKQ